VLFRTGRRTTPTIRRFERIPGGADGGYKRDKSYKTGFRGYCGVSCAQYILTNFERLAAGACTIRQGFAKLYKGRPACEPPIIEGVVRPREKRQKAPRPESMPKSHKFKINLALRSREPHSRPRAPKDAIKRPGPPGLFHVKREAMHGVFPIPAAPLKAFGYGE
jgi:hypothetical protein